MPDIKTIKGLLQRAMDLCETASIFTRNAAIKCHLIGMQGEKRRLRYLSRKNQILVDHMQHDPLDVFDPPLELTCNAGPVDTSSMSNPQSCMRKIIDTMWKVHDECHAIANELVVAKMRSLSSPIYAYCDILIQVIGEMTRNYRSYEFSGWDWHHISRHQETECNIHDEYEKAEEAQGYADSK